MKVEFICHDWYEDALENWNLCSICTVTTRRFTQVMLGGQATVRIQMCNRCQPYAELACRLGFIPKKYLGVVAPKSQYYD